MTINATFSTADIEKADLDYRLRYLGIHVAPKEDYGDVGQKYGLRELTPLEREAYVSTHTNTNSR